MLAPSLKAEREQDAEEKKADKLKEDSYFKGEMERLFSYPEAKAFLKWLIVQTDRNISKVKRVYNPKTGETRLDTELTVYAAMRETLYLEIREFVPTKILKGVEYDNRR